MLKYLCNCNVSVYYVGPLLLVEKKERKKSQASLLFSTCKIINYSANILREGILEI